MRKPVKTSEITERPRAKKVRGRGYGLSLLRLALPLLLLPCAALSQEAAPEAAAETPTAQAPQEFPRRVAVYVAGGVSEGEKGSLGEYLLASLVGSGACASHENSAAFLAAAGEEQSKTQEALDDARICEIGRQFGIRYICAAVAAPADGAVTVSAKMLNTETGKARLSGEASGRLTTAEELTQLSEDVVKMMLYRRAFGAQEAAAMPDSAAAAAKQGRRTVAVYMSGEEPKGAKGVHRIVGGELVRAMNESGRYTALDRTEAIHGQLSQESGGVLDDGQIKTVGRQLGVEYLCISDIDFLGKRYSLDTRLVNVATAEAERSARTTSTFRDAAEMARIGRNAAHELLGGGAPQEPRVWKKTILRGTAISLDALGVLAFAYGFNEDRNVVKHIERVDEKHIKNGPEADKAAEKRNIAYIVSGVLLASGVTIHFFF